jgi:hypothetical protein
MRTLAFLSILQSLTTGAYIAACAETNAGAADWAFAGVLAIACCLFACYVIVEESRGARR